MIGALVVAAVIGAVFSWALNSSLTANQLIEIQENDAMRLRDAVKPRVAAFEELATKINSMSNSAPQFDLVEELSKAEFAVAGSILTTVTIPLPGTTMDNVANYAADTIQLQQMISDHRRYTNDVDKEELLKLIEDNKAVQENMGFGVLINPETIAENYKKDDYRPPMGMLVGVKSMVEDQKRVEITILPAGDVRQVPYAEFVGLDPSAILKAGGQNALARHSLRVRNLKFQVHKISQYTTAMLDSLEVASGGEAGSAPAAPAAAPAEEPEPAAAPAEEEAAEEEAAPAE